MVGRSTLVFGGIVPLLIVYRQNVVDSLRLAKLPRSGHACWAKSQPAARYFPARVFPDVSGTSRTKWYSLFQVSGFFVLLHIDRQGRQYIEVAMLAAYGFPTGSRPAATDGSFPVPHSADRIGNSHVPAFCLLQTSNTVRRGCVGNDQAEENPAGQRG